MIITARPQGEQLCWSELWTRFSARTALSVMSEPLVGDHRARLPIPWGARPGASIAGWSTNSHQYSASGFGVGADVLGCRRRGGREATGRHTVMRLNPQARHPRLRHSENNADGGFERYLVVVWGAVAPAGTGCQRGHARR